MGTTLQEARTHDVDETAAPNRRGGIAGIAFVVLIVVQGIAAGSVPSPTSTGAEITTWLASHQGEALVYAYLLSATSFLFLFFAVANSRRLRRLGASDDLTLFAAIAAVGSVAVILVCAITQVTSVYLVGGDPDPHVEQALYVMTTIGGNVAAASWGTYVGTATAAGWRLGRSPWHRWLGVAATGGLAVVAVNVTRVGPLNGTGATLIVGMMLFLTWTLVTSIELLRQGRAATSSTREGGTAGTTH